MAVYTSEGEIVSLQRDVQFKIDGPTGIDYSLLQDGIQAEIAIDDIDTDAINKRIKEIKKQGRRCGWSQL